MAEQQYKVRSDVNHVTFVGRVGNARFFDSGNTPSLRLSVANARAAGKGESLREETSWIPVVVFGKSAENLHKLGIKGYRVAVSGRLQAGRGRKVQTVDNGGQEFELRELEVIADMRDGLQLLQAPGNGSQGSSDSSGSTESSNDKEEIPF